MLNPYDFFYKDDSHAVIRTQTATKLIQISEAYIWTLMDKYPDFKKRWLKSIFLYSLRIGKGL